MAEKRRFLDVWLVESNTVYREVPFTVVIDWVQQSRLVADDRYRPSGTSEWLRLGESSDFSPYLPRPEAFRVGDEAEALEPVQLDFVWRHKAEEEDDDVDMIPLIDISLVLLIFFIMTATGIGASALINTPVAVNGLKTDDPELLWVGIDLGPDEKAVFSVGKGAEEAAPDDRDLNTLQDLLRQLDAQLTALPGTAAVTIRAHKNVESGIVRDLTAELTRRSGITGKISRKYITVSEGE